MKHLIILYLVNNKIQSYLPKENYWKEYELPIKTLKDGKIVNRPKFEKSFLKILKKEKLIKKFQKNIIYLITPPNWEEIDKEIFKIILEDTSIENIKMIKESNLYDLKKNTLWINLNINYAFCTLIQNDMKKTYIWNDRIPYPFQEFISKLLETYPKIKKIILIGSFSVQEILPILEKKSKKIILYYEEREKYLIKNLLLHNLP